MSAIERAREKESWRRFAFLAAEVINISGKSVKHAVRADQLIKFNEGDVKRIADPGKRRAEMAETVKAQKEKCWALISDASIKKVTGDHNG